jgi:putative membrane protein
MSVLDHRLDLHVPFTPTPFQIVGVALAILMGFRNSAAYDRWWEGRKLWGGIVNTSRAWARQVLTLAVTDDADRRSLVLRHLAWVHALAAQLRGQDGAAAAAPFLDDRETERLRGQKNVAAALIHEQGVAIARLAPATSEERLARLDVSLTELIGLQGGCERIAATPLPLAYRFFTRQFVRGYCLVLPLGLVEHLGLFTTLVVVLVSFVFLVAEAIGRLLEAPFSTGVYGLPLSTISRNIEINLRQQLGDSQLPSPIAPQKIGSIDNLV